METANLIAVKQLPVIEEQLKAVRDKVVERTQDALNMVCTEDNYKDIKKVRADLNREFSQFEVQRKGVKNQIMEPYDEFEATYNHCIGEPYKRADAALKEKISQVETGLKEAKEAETRDYFLELCQVNGIDWMAWERTGIKATMSTSINQLKTAAENIVNRITAGMAAISEMENSAEIMVEFQKTLEVTDAVQTVAARHRAMEAQREAEEKRKAAEAERKAHEAEVKAAMEARKEILDPPKAEEPPKMFTMKFSVSGTMEQLRALKNYMNQEGIIYGSI